MDTIELLEAIGTDASLRHASAAEMARRLDQAGASEALKSAAATGDSACLFEELGHKPMRKTHFTHAPGQEEDEPEENEDGDAAPGPASDPNDALPVD